MLLCIRSGIASITITDDADRAAALALMDEVTLQRMPYPEYLQDGFLYAIKFGLPMLLMLSLLFTALTIVRNLVHEKERRLKESMKMMGLQNWTHWLAWFLQSYAFLFISMSIVAFETKLGNVFKYSDATVIWVFLLAFALVSRMQGAPRTTKQSSRKSVRARKNGKRRLTEICQRLCALSPAYHYLIQRRRLSICAS